MCCAEVGGVGATGDGGHRSGSGGGVHGVEGGGLDGRGSRFGVGVVVGKSAFVDGGARVEEDAVGDREGGVRGGVNRGGDVRGEGGNEGSEGGEEVAVGGELGVGGGGVGARLESIVLLRG